MNFLKENFIVWNIKGIIKIMINFFHYLFQRYGLLPLWEKIFFAIPLLLWFFLMQHWKAYHIQLENLSDYHGIYTNDLLIFFTLISILFITSLYIFVLQPISEYIAHRLHITRISISSLIFLVFFITLIFPERITSAKEASFTLWFYLFGLFASLGIISGVLGIKTTPRTDEEPQ